MTTRRPTSRASSSSAGTAPPAGASASRENTGLAPPRWWIGTSGYSYAAWKGRFYPRDLPASRMLEHYASRFPAVEINSTFYRMASPASLARWRDGTPEGFRFALKAPARITHHRRLVGVDAELAAFIDGATALGPKLGPLLIQLPPDFERDDGVLARFLEALPTSARATIEFRHASWFDDAVYALLRRSGAALCIAESDELATPLVATAPWGYLRLRKTTYGAAELAAWADRIRAQRWSDAHIFLKHEDEARGPGYAAALAELLAAGA